MYGPHLWQTNICSYPFSQNHTSPRIVLRNTIHYLYHKYTLLFQMKTVPSLQTQVCKLWVTSPPPLVLLWYVFCCFSVAQLCPTLWDPGLQHTKASLSFTVSQNLLKPMSIESVMPSNHLIICRPLVLLPSIFPSIRVFSKRVSSSHHVAKVLELRLQYQPFQWISAGPPAVCSRTLTCVFTSVLDHVPWKHLEDKTRVTALL